MLPASYRKLKKPRQSSRLFQIVQFWVLRQILFEGGDPHQGLLIPEGVGQPV